MVILGDNFMNIEMHHDGMYRVVTRRGKELASGLSRDKANTACCALCIPKVDDGLDTDMLVYLSFQDMQYRAADSGYVPEWHEIMIGPLSDVVRWQNILLSPREARV